MAQHVRVDRKSQFSLPTGALDQDSTAQVEEVLRERLAAGTAILMVTHSAAQAERLAHRHLRMENRHLVSA